MTALIQSAPAAPIEVHVTFVSVPRALDLATALPWSLRS
jgi:hypothetical protein